MNARVSVIIPTYKGANNLPRAIESVLNQTYKDVEIIVVDDNDPLSKERMETEEAVGKFSGGTVRYIQHECNKNGAAARNTGIFNCTGNYICFLDDDDFYMPGRIRESVEALEANPDFDAVYGGVIIASNHQIEGIVMAEKPLTQKDLLMNGMALGTGSNLFLTRKAVVDLGGFDEVFRRHQDLEFMLRFLERYSMLNLDGLLIVKATNGTNNVPEYTGLVEVKERYLKKFGHVIDSLGEQEKRSFLIAQYEELFVSAAMSKNKDYIEGSRKDLERFRQLTVKDRLLIFVTGKDLSKTKLYKKVRPIYNAAKDKWYAIKLNRFIDAPSKAFVSRTLEKPESVVSSHLSGKTVAYGKHFERAE